MIRRTRTEIAMKTILALAAVLALGACGIPFVPFI